MCLGGVAGHLLSWLSRNIRDRVLAVVTLMLPPGGRGLADLADPVDLVDPVDPGVRFLVS